MLPPHIKTLGMMWATKTFVFKHKGKTYNVEELKQTVDTLVKKGDIDSLYKIGAIEKTEYDQLKAVNKPKLSKGPTCSQCLYFAYRFPVNEHKFVRNYCMNTKSTAYPDAPSGLCIGFQRRGDGISIISPPKKPLFQWRPVNYETGHYTCEVCSYSRPYSEGPKAKGFTDWLLRIEFKPWKYEVWCVKRQYFISKNHRNRSCGSWHYGE